MSRSRRDAAQSVLFVAAVLAGLLGVRWWTTGALDRPMAPATAARQLHQPDGHARTRYYAGRLIQRDGRWLFVAWRSDGGDGRFLGELSDPMPLTVHADGSLSVQLPVATDR